MEAHMKQSHHMEEMVPADIRICLQNIYRDRTVDVSTAGVMFQQC